MGKQSGKKKKHSGGKSGDTLMKQGKVVDNSPKGYDKDTAAFIQLSQELKEEGNKHFQKRDYEGAMLKYEKALKLLPRNHIDVSYLRSNTAACYMELGLSDYPRAIHECNLALEVTPRYSKALLKRAKCYEALGRLDLALRDANSVLKTETNNLTALEIAERVQKTIDSKGVQVIDKPIDLAFEYVEPPCVSPKPKEVKEKTRKKKSKKLEEKKAEDKVVVEEKVTTIEKINTNEKITTIEEEPKKTVKLVFEEDIRWAQLPVNCSLWQLRKVIFDRFPTSKAVLVKYRDQEGDLVTITTNEELQLAEALVEAQSSFRLYVVEVTPDKDPFYERIAKENDMHELSIKQNFVTENESEGKSITENGLPSFIDAWIIQFAQLFKNHVGFDSDAYLNLHELGMDLYSEAMDETVTSEQAQDLFNAAAQKFQEMAALALFNWGNVHMSRAKKRLHLSEDASNDAMLEKIKTAYEWAKKEYVKAGQKYEETLKIKPDFYEGILAMGQQQFEQAKLSWYYAIGSNIDLETWSSTEVLQLYNDAEDNIEKGMKMWEELEEPRLKELSKSVMVKSQEKTRLDGLFEDMPANEVLDQASNIRSQIYLLWGKMLYERSIVEFKLEIPVWNECLGVAVEKFELAGASPTDMAVMIKNHCSNDDSLEGFGFQIDEIIQAWNEMYEAKKWQIGVPSFRLEPLLRRRVSKLYSAFAHCRSLH